MTNASDFSDWLNAELRARDWKQADLVRRSGISSGLISQILSSQRRPGIDTIVAIAHALDIPEVVVMARVARGTSYKTNIDEEGEILLFEFYKLSAEERKMILDEIRGMRRVREERTRYEASS